MYHNDTNYRDWRLFFLVCTIEIHRVLDDIFCFLVHFRKNNSDSCENIWHIYLEHTKE